MLNSKGILYTCQQHAIFQPSRAPKSKTPTLPLTHHPSHPHSTTHLHTRDLKLTHFMDRLDQITQIRPLVHTPRGNVKDTFRDFQKSTRIARHIQTCPFLARAPPSTLIPGVGDPRFPSVLPLSNPTYTASLLTVLCTSSRRT